MQPNPNSTSQNLDQTASPLGQMMGQIENLNLKYQAGNDPNEALNTSQSNISVDTPITIQVADPITREETFTKYTVYKIKGTDGLGVFQNTRRYNEFDIIRKILVNRWPGIYIPPLPEKKVIGNLDEKFIAHRRKHLDFFCQKIAEMPYLYYSSEFQTFLRSNITDAEKALQPFINVSYPDIITRYNATFKNILAGKEVTSKANTTIANFINYLKKGSSMFETFKSVAKSMSLAHKTFHDNFGNFNLHLMNDYEKLCVLEYQEQQDKHIFTDVNYGNYLVESIDKIQKNNTKATLEELSDLIHLENLEIQSMLEAISMKEKYEQLKIKAIQRKNEEIQEMQDALSGKTTLKSIFSGKKKEEYAHDQEKSVVLCNRDIECLQLINDMITVILTENEIAKFKKEKIERYFEMIKKLCEEQAITAKFMGDYWTCILENEKLSQPKPEQPVSHCYLRLKSQDPMDKKQDLYQI